MPVRFPLAIALAALLVVASSPARAADVFPDTPAGRAVAAWLAAFNAADESRLGAWFEAHLTADALAERPVAPRVARHQQMHGDLGDLTALGLEIGEGAIRLLARGAHGESVTVEFEPTPGDPARFAGFGLRVEGGGGPAPPAPRGAAPPNEAAFTARVRALCDSLAARDAFAGAVLVVQGGRTLVEQAWGEADRERHLANRTDTRFNLGSINKFFTKVAIAQLAEAGKLRLSDTLARWVPELPHEVASRVTIAQLVEHRAGFGDFFGPGYARADRSKLLRNADYLPLFANRPLEFEPGTRERYSNAGYVLLGLVIERASGEDYHDYVRRHVFAPAGMKDSESFPRDAATPNRAVGWTREDGGALRSNRDALPGRGSAAGGGYSTLRDLERFTLALRDHRLVGDAWTTWVLGGPVPADGETGRAGPPARGGLGVAGGTAGVNAALEFDLGAGTCVVVLANLDPPAAEDLAGVIADWLRRLPAPARP